MRSDDEKRILGLWPKYEDGSYVRLGDSYIDTDGDENEVMAIEFNDRCADLVGLEGFHTGFEPFERVKRPAPKVLDADGVEIEVGDTVYSIRTGAKCKVEGIEGDGVIKTDDEYGLKWRIINSHDVTHKQPVRDMDGVLIEVGDKVWGIGDINPATVVEVDGDAVHVQYFDGFIFEHKAAQLSHERHDSWERLEEDARQLDINLNDTTDDYPRMNFARDLIRRAKALSEGGGMR